MTEWAAEIKLSSNDAESVHICGIAFDRTRLDHHLHHTSALCSYENRVFLALTSGAIVILTCTLDDTATRVQLASEIIIGPRHDTDDLQDDLQPLHPPQQCDNLLMIPQERKYASMVPIKREGMKDVSLLLSGGHACQGSHLFRDIWEFSLDERKWRCLWQDSENDDPINTCIPAPFCAHTSLMLDNDTLLVVGGWPSHNLSSSHAFWAFRLSSRTWYPIDVNMTTRTAPIAQVHMPKQLAGDGTLQLIVGGGFGSDIRTAFVTLVRSTCGKYSALDPIIGLESEVEVRIAASQAFYIGLQITLGGLRPSKSAFCTILDVLNDRFVYRGDPFEEKGALPPLFTQIASPFSHTLPAAVVHLKHSPSAGVYDIVPVALMLMGGISFIRSNRLKQLIKQWLSTGSKVENALDSSCIDPLVNFFRSAPTPALSRILTFI